MSRRHTLPPWRPFLACRSADRTYTLCESAGDFALHSIGADPALGTSVSTERLSKYPYGCGRAEAEQRFRDMAVRLGNLDGNGPLPVHSLTV